MVGEHRQSRASPKLGKCLGEDFPPRSGDLFCASTHGNWLRCLGLLESQSERTPLHSTTLGALRSSSTALPGLSSRGHVLGRSVRHLGAKEEALEVF